jgi:hypothetical protein
VLRMIWRDMDRFQCKLSAGDENGSSGKDGL